MPPQPQPPPHTTTTTTTPGHARRIPLRLHHDAPHAHRPGGGAWRPAQHADSYGTSGHLGWGSAHQGACTQRTSVCFLLPCVHTCASMYAISGGERRCGLEIRKEVRNECGSHHSHASCVLCGVSLVSPSLTHTHTHTHTHIHTTPCRPRPPGPWVRPQGAGPSGTASCCPV